MHGCPRPTASRGVLWWRGARPAPRKGHGSGSGRRVQTAATSRTGPWCSFYSGATVAAIGKCFYAAGAAADSSSPHGRRSGRRRSSPFPGRRHSGGHRAPAAHALRRKNRNRFQGLLAGRRRGGSKSRVLDGAAPREAPRGHYQGPAGGPRVTCRAPRDAVTPALVV